MLEVAWGAEPRLSMRVRVDVNVSGIRTPLSTSHNIFHCVHWLAV